MTYKPTSIHTVITNYLSQFCNNAGQGRINIWANSRHLSNSSAYRAMQTDLSGLTADVNILDIRNLSQNPNSLKHRQLKEHLLICPAPVLVLVYGNNDPIETVVAEIKTICPKFDIQHFIACDNILGKYNAAVYRCIGQTNE